MKEEKKMGDMPDIAPEAFVPPMADISWVKRKYLDIPYDVQSKAQCLDIYLPEEGDGPFPCLIHIHGGGFAIGDKRDDHMDAYLGAIKRGMAAVSIEYRLSGEAAFPAAVLDVRQAIRFLRENADTYKLDATKFVAIGGSAGGNLAAILGMNVPNGQFPGEEGRTDLQTQPTVALAIDQFGPMNFATMDAQAKENGFSLTNHGEAMSPESKYIGCAIPEADAGLIAQANPATYISPAMTKILVQHGTHDRLVPYAQSVEFVEEIEKKMGADRVTFVPLEGADHEDKRFFAEENMDLVFAFIADNLKGDR